MEASSESSVHQHPKYGTTKVNSLTRRHCVELDTCWAVPVAAACITFLSCIVSSSYGYLYVLFMEELHVDREEAAWPQTALVISGGCVGLLVSVVQKKFSIYHITLVGGFITSAGVLVSSFAPNIAWLSVTFGVIQGAGVGTTLLGVAMYLLLYFDKYKATATAIKDIGTVAAGVAGVPWISLCVKKYGLQGSLLLSAGLILHILPLVMIMRTPRSFQICQGVAQGYIHCIRPVLIADHIGLGQFSLCCGVGGLLGVPVSLAGPAVLGFFRDSRGSYDNLYIMLAGLNLGVAVLLAVLVFQAATRRRRSLPKNVSPGITQEESNSL
ncbi:hypothetical protein MTO96_030359 [Rhipicephalus appendiculatus]